MVSQALSPEDRAALHAHPAQPTGPDQVQVLRDHAGDLAERYGVAAAEVDQGLQRLAKTFLGERADDAVVLDDTLRRQPLTLMADALDLMPGPEAVQLILNADLIDLDRRVRTVAWLASPDTPLYSHGELGHTLSALAADLHADREHLVKTGLPSRPYMGSPWLYHKLGRLYPTREATSFVSYAERFSNPRPGVPPYTWLQTPHRDVNLGSDIRECEYEQADFLPGLTAADGLRVEADRARLLDLKLRLLRRLAQSLANGQVGSSWTDVLAILTGTFTAMDVEFYAGLDGHGLPELGDPTTAGDPRSPGGLTALLEVAGHIEQELTVGTLAAARDALTLRTQALLRDMIQGGPDRDGVLPERLYLAVFGSPERANLDAAIDAVATRLDQAEAFWAEYRGRVNAAVRRAFRVHIVVPVALAHAETIGPVLQSYAAQAGLALDSGHWMTSPPAGMNVFRRDGQSWTIIFNGKVVGRPDAVGLFYLRLLLEYHNKDLDVRVLSRTLARSRKDEASWLREVLVETIGDLDVEIRRETSASPLSDPGEKDEADLGGVADPSAMNAYEARMTQLHEEIEAASEAGDTMKANGLQKERQEINKHRMKVRGFKGGLRRMSVPEKKVRDAVVKAINEAVEGLRQALPALHTHLEAALHTGPRCSYRPTAPVNWQF